MVAKSRPDGLLSGGIPGVVDAWYTLLDRWGTMSFEQVLQPAIALADDGFPRQSELDSRNLVVVS